MAEKDEKKKGGEEEGEEQTQAAPAAAPGGKRKLLIIGGFVAALLIGAGVPTAILLMKKSEPKLDQVSADLAQTDPSAGLVAEGANDEEDLQDDEERLGAIAPLDTFVVNLSGGRYLRAQIQVEFQGSDIPTRFITRMVPIRDGVIAALTKKTEADLDTPKGKEDLKNEIKDLMNEAMHKQDVKRVYFTQFVIQ